MPLLTSTSPPRTLAAALLIVGLAACSSGPSAPDESVYISEVETARHERNERYRTAEDSPIPPELKDVLLPLQYFPPDQTYSVPAALRLSSERPVVEMPTSTGRIRRMQRVGVLEFTLQGQPMTLGAFVEEGTRNISQLFIPFADLTTGEDTYFAGRYLDLHPTPTGLYIVDFNHAYNPYCAYNEEYDCPYPPAANRLKVSIRAGEKNVAESGPDA